MGIRTLGRVIAKWTTLAAPLFAGFAAWAAPLPPLSHEELRRFYLRVAVLHPQTEQSRHWTVACTCQAQWERYPIGRWLRLWVRGWGWRWGWGWGWGPLMPLGRVVTIEEQ